jgi:phage terminase large subunit-like protein
LAKNAEQQALELVAKILKRRETYKLDYYQPYDFQKRFHNAVGHKSTYPAKQRVLMTGNGQGKTTCGAAETAYHLTGRYPEWWKGTRFLRPIICMVGGMTNEAVRDICQKQLFGDPNEPGKLGTGMVPISCIGKRTSKPGVPNAYDTVNVKHVSGGWSKVMFRAYEQGPKKHMGHRIHVGWLDEEPPQDIWSQYGRATIAMNGILYITFTPEQGLTNVVNGFLNDLKSGQSIVQATWQDTPHLMNGGKLTEEAEQLLSVWPKHEHEMRIAGVPMYGAGLVFPFAEEKLVVEPFEIPRHWPQITGIDFGGGMSSGAHPFGAAKLAWDRDSDTVYVTADYREGASTPPIHAAAIKPWGSWIPVAWPHDGLNTEKSTGDELIKSYRDNGLNCLPHKATSPPDPKQGQKEGEGGNSVEASLYAMYQRMETGRWKVFKTCRYWLEERRVYHRDEQGKLVKLRDDVLSASRYAHMMLRHARVEHVHKRRQVAAAGISNW